MSRTAEKEASLALAGADYVREKLIALSGVGPNSLYDQVYAIKVRVKSLDSLVEKIREKNKGRKTPDSSGASARAYSAFSATDIVGMRLLCLYSEDLLGVTQSFVKFLKFIQSDSVSLLYGEHLDDAIHEIQIFKSDSNEKPYDAVYSYCKELNLSQVNDNGEEKVRIHHSPYGEKTYSSIHIVCFALSYSSGVAKRIPVEFQIRTIFEDAWGEIDHELEYKLKRKISRKLNRDLAESRDSFREILKELKKQLEQAGSLAEKLRAGYQIFYDTYSPSTKVNAWPFKLRAIFYSVPFENRLSPDVLARYTKDVDMHKLLEEAASLREEVKSEVADARDARRLLKRVGAQLDLYDRMIKRNFSSIDLNESEEETSVFYFLKMESAINRVWYAKLSLQLQPGLLHEYTSAIESSRNVYLSLEKEEQFRNDTVLNFRLGCLIDELGPASMSRHFFEQAMNGLQCDASVRDNQFSTLIPAHAGYSVWEARSELFQLGMGSKNPLINRDEQKNIVSKALTFSLVARSNYAAMKKHTQNEYHDTEEFLVNNILSFVWEIRDLALSRGDFDQTLESVHKRVKRYVENYEEQPVFACEQFLTKQLEAAEERSHELADTMLKLYHLKGDRERKTHWSEKVERIIASLDSRSSLLAKYLEYTVMRSKRSEKNYELEEDFML